MQNHDNQRAIIKLLDAVQVCRSSLGRDCLVAALLDLARSELAQLSDQQFILRRDKPNEE